MGKAESIVAGLGGAADIVGIQPCATRLRTEVRDPAKVDHAVLRAAGAYGVLAAGPVVQVVVGAEADALAADIGLLLG
ncbi:MAG TPA: PTS transporter subunit EIIB [Mycobacteriales bacterium]